jgi:hypothetical protein
MPQLRYEAGTSWMQIRRITHVLEGSVGTRIFIFYHRDPNAPEAHEDSYPLATGPVKRRQ